MKNGLAPLADIMLDKLLEHPRYVVLLCASKDEDLREKALKRLKEINPAYAALLSEKDDLT